MPWLEPVTLRGPHARLEPLSAAHREDLVGSYLARDHTGDRHDADKRRLDHSRDRLQAEAV